MPIRVLQLAILAEVVVFVVSTTPGVREGRGFEPPLDGWLQGGAYVTIALLAAARPLLVREERRLWTWIAVALGLRALAFVVYLAVIRGQDPPTYPSVADAAWILSALALLAALAGLVRMRLGRVSATLVLDSIVAGMAIAAIGVELLHGTLEARTAPGVAADAVVTNLAYPVIDAVLLLVILGLVVAWRFAPPRPIWVLAAGVAGFAVTDSVFLYQSTAGTFRPGSPLSALSLVATAAIAFAGWTPRGRAERERSEVLPGMVLPTVAALACLGLLVYAAREPVPLAAIVLAAGGLVVAIARAGMSFRVVRGAAEMRREARTDELTGAANRRAFNERLRTALRDRPATRPLALLVIDLDDFKDVNDLLGHHHGDELLALVAPRLKLALRSGDLLARIGGDEFAIVLDDADEETALRVADRLHSGFRAPFDVGGRGLPVTASVGVAVFPQNGDDVEALLRAADLAMYDAKADRAGYRLFSAEHHRTTRERLESAERLRQAIVGDELVLHYQPQVSLITGDIVGVEALVRWAHPERGTIAPGHFLGQVESSGLMQLLSLNVLGQAIRQAAEWRDRGIDVPVSVNLSVSNLLDSEFPDLVVDQLAACGVPGSSLVLELTEDLFMADPDRGRDVIRRLLASDVRIAVDDYGTGYSSLGYLRELHDIACLKLDRSFVTPLAEDPRAAAIVRSTVALAQSLGLRLVAEGVETEAVRDRLAALGCEVAQGYLFSRPVPADALSFGRLERARALR